MFNECKWPLTKRIGIVGGGQLGKMMILEAKKMGFYVTILDPTLNCPAHSIADFHIVADFDSFDAYYELGNKSDVITYEFEHINVSPLKKLEELGKAVYPTVSSLCVIQNKFTQKEALQNAKIPVPKFMSVKNVQDIKEAADVLNYPLMLKNSLGGYDGKGNALIENENNILNAFNKLGGSAALLMVEEFIPFDMEISVLACRGTDGEVVVYPVAENIHSNSILIETRVPAAISDNLSKEAMKTADSVMRVFSGVGMFCVEMFVTKEDKLYVNEVAPRPHNSGHYTIEGCVTSQFMQHIRAISGIPLGDTTLRSPTVMLNILGEEGCFGKANVEGVKQALAIKGVSLHIYGKEQTIPRRKMGHITSIAETVAIASSNANAAKKIVRVVGDYS